MSNNKIRKALERALKAFDPDFPTAWENVNFEPEEWPYQSVAILFAEPENPTMGDDFYRQRGFMQVKLYYPLNVGPGTVEARAELLRTAFKRGLSLEADGVITVIDRTPEIAPGANEADRYVVLVRIRFYANITNGA
jgi:hypothetical protein